MTVFVRMVDKERRVRFVILALIAQIADLVHHRPSRSRHAHAMEQIGLKKDVVVVRLHVLLLLQ